jgi:hypothetical protein
MNFPCSRDNFDIPFACYRVQLSFFAYFGRFGRVVFQLDSGFDVESFRGRKLVPGGNDVGSMDVSRRGYISQKGDHL